MSVKLMAVVFDSDLPPVKRLVMLALADHANDDGVCYPSVARLRNRTGLSERAIQKHISELEVSGHLTRGVNQGQNGANIYRLTPAPCAPPHDVHPRTTCTTPPHDVRPTPARRAPKPSRTIKEPSVSKETPVDVLCKIVRRETATDFAAHRKAMRKPLTHEAAKRLVIKLKDHPNPDAVFDLSIENGWQGVFPEKVGGSNVKPSKQAERLSAFISGARGTS